MKNEKYKEDTKQAPTSATNVDSKQYEDKSVMWSTRYQTAVDYQKPMMEKWGKWYDDMYAHVHVLRSAPWRSKVYMPIISSKVWDLIARFIQYRPGWNVSVRDIPKDIDDIEKFEKYVEENQKRADKVKAKLEYDYDNPLREEPIQDEILSVMLDACVTGTGLARVPYTTCQRDYHEYSNTERTQATKTTKLEGHNGFEAVNIFNVFTAPGGKSLQKSPWLIIHDFVPIFELQSSGTKYINLDKVKTNGLSNEFASMQQSKNRLVNTDDTTVLDSTVQIAEVFECWDKATNEFRVYAVGNGKDNSQWVEILPPQENFYWHGKYPFVDFHVRKKPYQFWGESIFENSETLQSAVNDIFNKHMDRDSMTDGMIAIEEGSVVEPYIIMPGGELRYRGEMPKQFKFPSPDAAAMQTALNLVNGAIENATIPQYASGVPNGETDNTEGTATGVTRLMEAAAEKVGFMRANFRRSWREVGNMWNSNTQQFMQNPVVVDRDVRGKKLPQLIKPADLKGVYEIKIDDGSFEPISKDAQRKDYLDYVANLADWQDRSDKQAELTGEDTDRLRIDWNDVAAEGGRLYGQQGRFLLPAKKIEKPQESSQPATQPTPQPVVAPVAPPPLEMPAGMTAPTGPMPINPDELLQLPQGVPA